MAPIQSNCTGNTSAAVTIDNVNSFYLTSLRVVNGFATGAASTTANRRIAGESKLEQSDANHHGGLFPNPETVVIRPRASSSVCGMGGAAASGSMIEDNICDMNDPNSANNLEFVRSATDTISGIAFQNNLHYTTSNPE